MVLYILSHKLSHLQAALSQHEGIIMPKYCPLKQESLESISDLKCMSQFSKLSRHYCCTIWNLECKKLTFSLILASNSFITLDEIIWVYHNPVVHILKPERFHLSTPSFPESFSIRGNWLFDIFLWLSNPH